jgi:hypothetical protein
MKFTFTFLFCVAFAPIFAQEISIVEVENVALGGLQSFVHAEYADNVIVFGGRLDGLHRRQPFATFDIAGHNTGIQIWNTTTNSVNTYSTANFADSLEEQIHSTNANFTQDGEFLLVAGGYGYSAIAGDHVTFPRLIVFHLPTLIAALESNASLDESIVFQSHHADFAVTGGKLVKMDNLFYLIGGHRFDGRYNPMGPDHGPGFSQVYTNAIRRFEWSPNNGLNLLSQWTDANLLHRRDFNVLAGFNPATQQQNISIYSGVFQLNNDIPYLNALEVSPQEFHEVPDFAQYYNHYHCGSFGLYNAQNQKMAHYFFGGIAQYYDSLGVLVQDNNVPFVKTVAKVEQDVNGVWSEHLLPLQLPDYLGAGSEFIPAHDVTTYDNGVIQFDSNWANQDSILMGYLYGGIKSTAKNIFWDNEGDLSIAAPTLFAVYLHPNSSNGVMNNQSLNGWQMQVYPNPFNESIYLVLDLKSNTMVKVEWFDLQGKLIETSLFENQSVGKHEYVFNEKSHWIGGTYLMTVTAEGKSFTQRIIFDD